MVARFLKCLFAYFRLRFVGTAPSSLVTLPGSIASPLMGLVEAQGGLNNIGAIAAFVTALQANAAPQTGYQNYKSIATAASVTLNAATLPGGVAGGPARWGGGDRTTGALGSPAT